MQAPWIFSSTVLPRSGASIDFTIDDRIQPIHGTFADGAFHSRWADYGTDRVQSWRGSDADSADVTGTLHEGASTGSFVATLRRLVLCTGLGRSANSRHAVRRQRTAHPGLAAAMPLSRSADTARAQ